MQPDVQTTALFRQLHGRPDLLAKVTELRQRMTRYLRAVHTTFSHYTSHAIDHSDQIIRELSNLLFDDPSRTKTMAIDLNETEIYLLLLSAYLHDSGMVVAESEKFEAIGSDEWEAFATNHPLLSEAAEIVQGWKGGAEPTEPEQLFAKSLEQRMLLADYFRRRHAERAAETISGVLDIQNDFLDGDPAAAGAVIAITTGHGLSHSDLRNEANYPTRRDLFSQPVDVRLLTVLLRIGDLLDMRTDRACPLMLTIASPLPRSSAAHWTQYQRILSRVTSPKRVEVRAKCHSADEHRLLLDWCRWLRDEIAEAPRLLALSDRHSSWVAPHISDDGDDKTIDIDRAVGATYRVEDWRFLIDENEVFSRLINDIHVSWWGWVRELLQNALDATRARAYNDSGSDSPFPNLLPRALRARYPINVRLTVSSGRVTELEVEDRGIGMTPQIIQDYFLQVGRSWYRSHDFKQRFNFAATSKFGIGFLSTFAVSEQIAVTTRYVDAAPTSAVALQLTGPRNYLLVEDSERVDPGTTIKVTLNEPADLRALTTYLRELCIANEFEVRVSTIRDDVEEPGDVLPLSDTAASDTVVMEAGAIASKHIDSDVEGVFGQLTFPIVLAADGEEDWSISTHDLQDRLNLEDPLAFSSDLDRHERLSVNGLSLSLPSESEGAGDLRWDVDIRNLDLVALGLERSLFEFDRSRLVDVALHKALTSHLANRTIDEDYLLRLYRRFASSAPTWAHDVRILRTIDGEVHSWREVLVAPTYWLLYGTEGDLESISPGDILRICDELGIAPQQAVLPGALSSSARDDMFKGRAVYLCEPVKGAVAIQVEPSEDRYSYSLGRDVEFSADSELVRILGPMGFFTNDNHPLLAAVLDLGPEYRQARVALWRAIHGARGDAHSTPSGLRQLLERVSDLTGDPIFSAFARHVSDETVRRRKDFDRVSEFVRLPRDPTRHG